jgi:hypothetical protein
VGAGGEMTQALYAHMNNKRKKNSFHVKFKAGLVVQPCNLRTGETEARRSQVQGQPVSKQNINE